METVEIEMEIGKCEKDLIDAVCVLVKGLVKDKKPAMEVLALELPALIVIAGEISGLGAEFGGTDKAATAAYLAASIEQALK